MPDYVDNARNLRLNSTEAEKKLWHCLRNRQLGGFKFRRQHPFPPYTADFFCEEKSLIIEVDGGQHSPDVDQARTRELERRGLKILRFWNNEVLNNIEGVLLTITDELKNPSPQPSPEGRGSSKRILVGKIATAHGVRGLVKVMVFAEDPKTLEKHGSINISATGDKSLKLRMKNSLGSKGGKFWLAEVEGVTDRNAAEKLRGTELWLDRDKLPKPKKNEYYIEDLIGLTVLDNGGAKIGTISGMHNFGAGDMLDIQPQDGESFFLPFTKENIVKVDIAGKTVVVEIPEGIREVS